MSTQEEWGGAWSERIGHAIRRERQRRGWSAQKLADRCNELGVNITRSVITDMEIRPRQAVPVQTLTAVAAALDVEPVRLLYPLGEGDTPVEVIPGREMTPVEAIQWWTGYGGTAQLALEEREAHQYAVTKRDEMMRGQLPSELWDESLGDPVEAMQGIYRSALEELRSIRAEMTAQGMTPPPLDSSIRAAYDALPDDRET